MMRKKCVKNKINEYEVAHDEHDERNVHKEVIRHPKKHASILGSVPFTLPNGILMTQKQ
jgi:hypothetical protein